MRRVEDKDEESLAGTLEMMEEKQRLESERQREQQKLSEAIQSVLTLEDNSETDSDYKPKELPKLKEESIEFKPLESKQIQFKDNNESKERKTEIRVKTTVPESTSAQNSGLSAEEIHKRSEYLRKQRDKLLKIKKQERNKQMTKLEEQELLAKRPKSARVMRSVTDHTSDDESAGDQSLAFRRSLAARLKAEVIGLKRINCLLFWV